MTPWGQCPRVKIWSTTEDYWDVDVLYITCWIMEQRQFNTTPTATASTSCDTQYKTPKNSSLGLAASRLNPERMQTLHLLSLTLVAQQWVPCWGCLGGCSACLHCQHCWGRYHTGTETHREPGPTALGMQYQKSQQMSQTGCLYRPMDLSCD